MRSLNNLPLARKLTLIVAGTTALGMVITSLASIAYQTFTFANFMIVELEAIAEVVGKNATAALRFQVNKDAERILTSLRAKGHVTGALFLDPQGNVFATYVRSDDIEVAAPKVIKEGYTIDRYHLTWTHRVEQDGDFLGTVYIESDLEELYDQVVSSVEAMLIVTVAAAALALLLGFKFLRTVSAPINDLIQTASRVSQERDYSLRAKQYADDDLGKLSMGFNEMLGEIQVRDAEMEQRVKERTAALANANEELNASLQEKLVLLKEIHHRVKNNLQVISSLLSLQARDIADLRSRELFMNSQNRVQTMALIHERLYQSDDLSKLDFAEYIPTLAESLFSTYKTEHQNIALRVDVEDLLIELDQAIPCGLMINELVTNALKYAFPNMEQGTISIGLRAVEGDTIELNVVDDGIGLPEDISTRSEKSLGLQLINILTRQLRGQLEIKNPDRGTHFCITFPLMLESSTKNLR